MMWVQEGACKLLSIEERCLHVEDAKMTCTFISQSFNVNNPSLFITVAGLLSSPLLRLTEADLWTAVSLFQNGGMLRSTL